MLCVQRRVYNDPDDMEAWGAKGSADRSGGRVDARSAILNDSQLVRRRLRRAATAEGVVVSSVDVTAFVGIHNTSPSSDPLGTAAEDRARGADSVGVACSRLKQIRCGLLCIRGS